MFEDLLKRILEDQNEKAPDSVKDISALTLEELEEWNSLNACTEVLNAQHQKLSREKEVVEARITIFWYNLRRSHNISAEHIHIDDSRNVIQEIVHES